MKRYNHKKINTSHESFVKGHEKHKADNMLRKAGTMLSALHNIFKKKK